MREQYLIAWTLVFLGSTPGAIQYSPAPAVYRVRPTGVQRGTTKIITVEGINLENTSQLLFSKPGVAGRIAEIRERPGDKPYTTPIEQVNVEIKVSEGAVTGVHGFRLKTPYGTSNWVPFEIGSVPEVAAVEGNDSERRAQRLDLPVTVNGLLKSGGEADYYQFEVSEGKELVFKVEASALGSKLNSDLSLLNDRGELIAESNSFKLGRRDCLLGHKFAKPGRYIIRISDVAGRGGNDFYYRLTAGELPFVTEVFPLGVRRGTVRQAHIRGYNLQGMEKIELDGRLAKGEEEFLALRVSTPQGETVNQLKIGVGNYPEVLETEPNDDLGKAQKVSVPVTIDGRVDSAGDRDIYQFHARKGEILALEVMANRLGSPLDSVIEVLDIDGKPIPRAVLKAVAENSLEASLNSSILGLGRFNLLKNIEFFPLDFVLVNERELIRLQEAIRTGDDRSVAQGYLGQRLAFLGTTPQNHSDNAKVHKVIILPPDARPPPGELPVFRLYYRNDDGGPGYGKDSHLLFAAPKDGEYLVSVHDVRNWGGEQFTYRLTIRPATPDYKLFLDDGFVEFYDGRAAGSRNPNVPRGGSVPVTVAAHRVDGFNGEISVEVKDLPQGFHATQGTVRQDEYLSTVEISADMTTGEAIPSQPFRLIGRANINGKEVIREAFDPVEALNFVSLTPPPIITPSVDKQHLKIVAGGDAEFTIKIERHNEYAKAVGIDLKNLPVGIFVKDRATVTGTRIDAGENSRTIVLTSDPWVRSMTFEMVAVLRIWSEQATKIRAYRSLQQSVEYAAPPILVTVEESPALTRRQDRKSR